MSPVQPGLGIDASLPGGALRLDVDASEQSSAVTIGSDGVLVRGQYGAECVMNGRLVSSAYLATFGAGNFGAIPFGDTLVDYSEFSDAPQCDSTDGVFIANTEGIYEIGCQLVSYITGGSSNHLQLGIWTDYGFASLPLSPTIAFGTANGAFGSAWQRIAMSTIGSNVTVLPTIPDCPGVPINVVTQWCVKAPPQGFGVGATFPQTSAPPTRFRFGYRSDGVSNIISNTPNQAIAWMRWIGAPA